jgi:lambda repressor-like predicted transcriptional regulator
MTKRQLAKRAGVSQRTLQRWLDEPHMQELLAPFHLKKQQHILPPGAVKIICEHYVISLI